MTDKLNETLVEPVSGLTYRMQAARSGQGKAPCLILLHGVGANEVGFIELAHRMDPRLVVGFIKTVANIKLRRDRTYSIEKRPGSH